MRSCIVAMLLAGFSVPSLFAQDNPVVQGITVQQPVLGVSVDANGLFTIQLFEDPTGQLARLRVSLAGQRSLQPVGAATGQRKISLRGLAQAIDAHSGKPLPEDIRYLAGLKRIEYVLLVPERNDILLVGPAANWVEDLSGRVRAVDDGRPTLQLDDLIIALRTFAPDRPLNTWVACSIDPTPDGMDAYRKLLGTLPKAANAAQQIELARLAPAEIARAMGLADIRVWGIPRDSHLASVLIEADYRMKLMAVGLEPAPQSITTFAQAVEGNESGVQRWWLTPKYDILKQSDDQLALQLIGQGVQLNTENAVVLPGGVIQVAAAKPGRAARRYAESFTKHYSDLAHISPVFAELQSAMDLLMVAAWLNKNRGFAKVDWDGGALLNSSSYTPASKNVPKQTPCVANALWKRTTLILPAGGGVSIAAQDAVLESTIQSDTLQKLNSQRLEFIPAEPPTQWWWD